MLMVAGTPVDAAAEELARGQASQAQAFPAEVCLVGVPHVDRMSRDAVRTTRSRGRGTGLGQRK